MRKRGYFCAETCDDARQIFDEMTIYNLNGDAFYEAPITKNAVLKYALMGDYYISLQFNAARYLDIKRGYYILYNGKKFEVMTTVRPERINTGGYKYDVRFDAQQGHLKRRCLFWLEGSTPEATFHDTTTLDAFGKLIADNMNAFLGVDDWSYAAAPADLEGVTKTVTFDGSTCWDAINAIAEAFEVEWWIEEDLRARTIYFGKLEKGDAVPFRIGEAVTEIPSKRGEDTDYGTRFYVFGSDRNLPKDYSDTIQGGVTNHVSQVRLHLPDGVPYIDAREGLTPAEIVEKVVIFEEIYPKNTDTVTAIETIKREIVEGEENDAYVMTAANTPFIPSDLMAGETLSCEFTSGPLMGRQFELALLNDDNQNLDPEQWKEGDAFNKRFEIIAETEDAGTTAVIVPNEYLHPEVGNTFVLLGVKLPEERIVEASQELLEKGQEHAIKHSSDTDVYECPTNPVYCHKNGLNFDLGQRVTLFADRFEDGKRQSRIQGFEKSLWNEYEATYTVGDNTTYSRIGALQDGIKETQHEIVRVKDNVYKQFASTKRDMKDMQQTTSMLVESLLANFGDAISPVVVKTMMTLIGDESLQFRFVDSRVNPQMVTKVFSFDPELKVFYTDESIIQHMTLGINAISSAHATSDYMFWDIPAFESDTLSDATKSYYLYAKVSKASENGEWVLSETAISMEQEQGCYHLLTGILNSENNKERSFVPMYGYTEVLPGRVTTDLLTSPDGKLIIDLAKGHITGDVTFGSGSSGLTNFPEYKELTDRMDEVEDTTKAEYVIWFAEPDAGEDYLPSLLNYPAMDWTTAELKASHEWDIFYNRYSGRAWRFLGGFWVEITDADTIAALEQATEAKNRVDTLDYLKKALNSDEQETFVSGGLVLTSFVGVRNNAGDIVAALINANDGLPYFAAGIKDATDIGNQSKMVITDDGEIELKDVDAETPRKVRMSLGALEYFLGDERQLVQTPDKHTATPNSTMMFENLSEIVTEDITRYTGSATIDKTLSRGLMGVNNGASYSGSMFLQLSAIQAGVSFTSASTSSGINLIASVSGALSITLKITPQIRNASDVVLAQGVTSNISGNLIGSQIDNVSCLYNYKENEKLRFGWFCEYTYTLPADGVISSPMINITIPAGHSFTVYGNVAKNAYDNRLFGNGLFFGRSVEQYVGMLVDETNGAVFEMRNGSNGFRFSANGLQKWDGSKWVSL